ncbi:MAG TPA: hypothetical protein VFI52_15820 [Gemmatimonadaceae bacterium]|nr:hypothetical protein [Gemmatimonadaceae bacterium]
MDRYHFALFLHLVALVVAAGATAITKLAAGRRARARTVGEMLEWHDVLSSAARLFPLCLATFVITGSYMLSISRLNVWSSGFVVAGLAGSGLLLVSSVYLGVKGAALRRMLEATAARGADQPAPVLVPPTLAVVLPQVNSAIALAVAFDMVAKPASIGGALGVVALGVLMATASVLLRPARTPAGAFTASAAG